MDCTAGIRVPSAAVARVYRTRKAPQRGRRATDVAGAALRAAMLTSAGGRFDAHAAATRPVVRRHRLPAIGAEFEKLARQAADESHELYPLRLTELQVAARSSIATRRARWPGGTPHSEPPFDTGRGDAPRPRSSGPRCGHFAAGEFIAPASPRSASEIAVRRRTPSPADGLSCGTRRRSRRRGIVRLD